MGVEIKTPIVIAGVGGAGSRLAVQAKRKLNCKCVLISNDRNDLENQKCERVHVDIRRLLNPSSNTIRGVTRQTSEEILGKLSGAESVIIIANLAGKGGTGIAPILARMAKQSGKTVISFLIMPFRFESSRLFTAGVSLRRMKEASDCMIVVDNDALLHNNPELKVDDCYRITNDAVLGVLSSFMDGISLGNETNLLCTSKDTVKDAETALKDSFKMLYSEVDPDKVRRAMLYVIGGDRVPVGVLDSMVTDVQTLLGKNGTEVGLSLSSAPDGVRVLLMASVLEQTRFDSYDPLNIIPKECVIDWEEIESDLNLESTLPSIE